MGLAIAKILGLLHVLLQHNLVNLFIEMYSKNNHASDISGLNYGGLGNEIWICDSPVIDFLCESHVESRRYRINAFRVFAS